jgi:hypothetical protein
VALGPAPPRLLLLLLPPYAWMRAAAQPLPPANAAPAGPAALALQPPLRPPCQPRRLLRRLLTQSARPSPRPARLSRALLVPPHRRRHGAVARLPCQVQQHPAVLGHKGRRGGVHRLLQEARSRAAAALGARAMPAPCLSAMPPPCLGACPGPAWVCSPEPARPSSSQGCSAAPALHPPASQPASPEAGAPRHILPLCPMHAQRHLPPPPPSAAAPSPAHHPHPPGPPCKRAS